MPSLPRRTYLAAIGAATTLGLGGLAYTASEPTQAQPPVSVQRGANECDPPNQLLAKWEWDDGQFVFEKGDQDAVTITNVELDEEGEPVGVTYEANQPVCTVSIKAGQLVIEFPGNTTGGSIDLRDFDTLFDGPVRAISNIAFCIRPAQAIVCEADMNRKFEAVTHLDGDPAGGSRDGVVHAVSQNAPDYNDFAATTDYVHGMVNLRARLGRAPTLDELSQSGGLSYEYFEGEKNRRAAPDEVFLVLQVDDPASAGVSGSGIYMAVKTVNDGKEGGGEWRNQDVSSLFGQGWSDIDISGTPLGGPQVISSRDVIETAQSLRKDGTQFENVLTRYGGNATLVGVGFGAGNIQEKVVGDRYFDNLRVSPSSGSTSTFDFPAIVPTGLTLSTRGNTVTATLKLTQGEEGFDFADVSDGTVKLNPLQYIVPAAEPGVQATSVAGQGEELTVEFPKGPVEDILGDSGSVLVTGDLATDRVISFFGKANYPP